jgi:uncharacterized protein (TIGR00369 family)
MIDREPAAATHAAAGLADGLHGGCMACGRTDRNPASLRLAFTSRPDGSVSAVHTTGVQHQGYTGILHGGMVSMLLDAAMTHCLFAHGIAAVTAELLVRFVAPVKIGQRVELTARLIETKRRTYRLEARLTCEARLMARATAKFLDASRLPASQSIHVLPSDEHGCAPSPHVA